MTMRTVRRLMVAAVLPLVFVCPGLLRGDEAEVEAVQAVEALGGEVIRDEKSQGKPVTGVILDFSAVTDQRLEELVKFRHLRHLSLAGTQVTDAGMKHLAKLKNLQSLTLGIKVTGAGLKELRKALPDCQISLSG